jgi:hypothetical protein
MTRKLQQALRTQKRQNEQVNQQIPGLLGLPLDGRKVEVPNRQAFVFVRLRNNQSEVIQAYNNQVAPAYDLPVLVQRNGGRYEVIGVDTASYENNWNSNAPFLPRHGNTHSFDLETGGGGDVVWVHGRQFMPALVFPSGSVGAGNLVMSPYTLQNADGTWKYVGNTGTANITQHRPSSPTGAVMGLVYLDTISGNPYLLINSGTVFINSITGSSQVYPYIPTITNPATQIPLVAVRMITGTSRLSWDNIYDIRQFIHATPTGSSGGAGGTTIGLGVMAQDEGVPLGTGTTLNFVGNNVSATISGSVVRVYVTGSAGGSVNGPQGFGDNYRISASSSSGTLTVALKTMAGNDPSSTDKVVIRIANNLREVTAPLSFSLASGTNWFNAGSVELKDRVVDFFIYAVWDEGTSLVDLGIARVPYATRLSDLSSTSTNENYIAGATYDTSYRCEVIGRFPAQISGTPGFAWSGPSSALFVINRPIYSTNWLTWEPTKTGYSTNPTGTYSYRIDNKIAYLSSTDFTNGVSNATTKTWTLPIAAATVTNMTWNFPFRGFDNGAQLTTPALAQISSAGSTMSFFKDMSGAAWTASGNHRLPGGTIWYPLIE